MSFGIVFEVKLPYEPLSPSVGWLVGEWSVGLSQFFKWAGKLIF